MLQFNYIIHQIPTLFKRFKDMRNEIVKNNIPKTTIHASRSTSYAPPGIASSVHYHDELEFIVNFDGVFSCTVDGKEYIAKKGEIIFINSRIPHSTCRLSDCLSGLIQFKESNFIDTEISHIIKYFARLRDLDREPVHILRSVELFEIASKLLDEATSGKSASDLYIKSYVYYIMGYLYRHEILSDGETFYRTKQVQKILPALSYINERHSEDITLDQVSAMLGFDPGYFCRIFKSATGATFTEYLNFVRVCKSEKHLKAGDMSILEISESVGFSSVSYYNRIFKKYHSCAPSVYRNTKYIAISKGEKE